MKKDTIKTLANNSFLKGRIDDKKVVKIASALKREDLKVYIKSLKDIQARNTVFISVPSKDNMPNLIKEFERLFPNKKISIELDPTLMAGIRIVDYDNVYELSIKDILEKGFLTRND